MFKEAKVLRSEGDQRTARIDGVYCLLRASANPVDFLCDALLCGSPTDPTHANNCIKGKAANFSHASLTPELTPCIRITNVGSLIDEYSHVVTFRVGRFTKHE